MYTCSVTGTGFTIWRGSAFNCPSAGSQILLSHSLFGGGPGGASGSCNGALIGASVNVDGSIYTSQLMVNLAADSSLIGERIECVHRSSNGVETIIGSLTIQLADPLPPPSNIRLADINPSQLTFSWTAVVNQSTCPSVQYELSSNCGSCMNDSRATQTSKTCAIEQSTTTERQCYFSVQTLICGNVAGILSERINLLLKVPGPPLTSNIRVLPHYNASDQRLLVLDMEFDELSEFFISDRVSGSVLSYTITYSNSATNTLCDSLTIYPNQSCSQETCAVPSFNPVPCSQTVTDGVINVAISATNVLGNGPPSIKSADFVNRVVKISFESDTRIVCIFLRESSSKSCSIDYGVCGLQLDTIHREGQMNSSGMAIIDLLLEGLQSRVYCYTINASSDDTSVFLTGARIRGSYSNDCSCGPNVAAIVIGVLFMVVLFILSITTGVIIILFVVKRSKRTNLTHYKSKATEPQSLPGSRMGSQINLLSSNPSSRRESVDLSSGSGSAGLGPGVLTQKINVSAHTKFNVEDKPRELVKALKKLEDGGINIRTIRSYPFSGKTEGTASLRTIYIEFENDLTTANEAAIEKMKLGHGNSLVVSCKPTVYNVDIYEDFHSLTSKLKVIDEGADEEPHEDEDKEPHSITAV